MSDRILPARILSLWKPRHPTAQAPRLGARVPTIAAALLLGLAGCATTAPPTTAPPPPDMQMTLEPRATDLMKATSARLAAARTIAFTATVDYEYPSRLGPPIVYRVRYNVTMQRPNRLRVVIPGDGPASEFIFDGKTVMAYSPEHNLTAMAEGPTTIEGALREAFTRAAIYYPFADLLADDPYASLAGKATLGFSIGQSRTVGGTTTNMVAASNDDVFLQLWLGAADRLPRRIRAIYSADPQRLRHDMELSNWVIDGAVAPGTFAGTRARAAKRMPFGTPGQLAPAPSPGQSPAPKP